MRPSEQAAVEAALLEVLAQLRPANTAGDSDGAAQTLALDSLDMVELSIVIEERWGVQIRAAQADEQRTVSGLAGLIVRLRSHDG